MAGKMIGVFGERKGLYACNHAVFLTYPPSILRSTSVGVRYWQGFDGLWTEDERTIALLLREGVYAPKYYIHPSFRMLKP